MVVIDSGSARHQHRSRLLEGMARAVASKGYADTTIADIVREASVSRRTFYEHFSTKAECLIALYGAASHNALKVLQAAIDPAHDWRAQVRSALSAYLRCMAENPVLLRTLFIEILGLGPEGLEARRRVNTEIAEFVLRAVNGGQGKAGPLSPVMATAIVGGINELVLACIEQDRMDRLQELVEPSTELIFAVTAR
jgi:AcrR family transcriptional regulator